MVSQEAPRARTSAARAPADFGDLLLHMLVILSTHRDVLEQYQQRFRYIMVDEYQDTNTAQYMWLRLLAQRAKGEPQNVCCVGDDDQSIYGWRGAEVGNILRFETDFPGAQVIRLEQNYRSTPHILAAASGLIAANKGRLGKTLWTESEGGEKLRLIGHWDSEAEARWIGGEPADVDDFTGKYRPQMARDIDQAPVFLAKSSWETGYVGERFPKIAFTRTKEHPYLQRQRDAENNPNKQAECPPGYYTCLLLCDLTHFSMTDHSSSNLA